MAWTSPRTYTTGEIVTAAILNTDVRDNLLETAPAKATTAGDLFVATGANALKRLGLGTAKLPLRVNDAGTDVAYAQIDGDGVEDGSLAATKLSFDPATQAELDAHASATSVHSATSAATANRIILRDAAGRAKVAAPSASTDIALKSTVDAHATRTDNPHSVTAAQVGAAASAIGSYTGDGTNDRHISVGFTPRLVYVGSGSGGSLRGRLGYRSAGTLGLFFVTGGAVDPADTRALRPDLDSTGFFVSGNSVGDLNENGVAYSWMAIG